jgi:hypothetical protein
MSLFYYPPLELSYQSSLQSSVISLVSAPRHFSIQNTNPYKFVASCITGLEGQTLIRERNADRSHLKPNAVTQNSPSILLT